MDARAERVGRNEALFREVNEQVESLNRRFSAAVEDAIDIVCECADLACIERITVPLTTYERVRSESTLFLVKPGHEQGDIEDVVAERGFTLTFAACTVVVGLGVVASLLVPRRARASAPGAAAEAELVAGPVAVPQAAGD